MQVAILDESLWREVGSWNGQHVLPTWFAEEWLADGFRRSRSWKSCMVTSSVFSCISSGPIPYPRVKFRSQFILWNSDVKIVKLDWKTLRSEVKTLKYSQYGEVDYRAEDPLSIWSNRSEPKAFSSGQKEGNEKSSPDPWLFVSRRKPSKWSHDQIPYSQGFRSHFFQRNPEVWRSIIAWYSP